MAHSLPGVVYELCREQVWVVESEERCCIRYRKMIVELDDVGSVKPFPVAAPCLPSRTHPELARGHRSCMETRLVL